MRVQRRLFHPDADGSMVAIIFDVPTQVFTIDLHDLVASKPTSIQSATEGRSGTAVLHGWTVTVTLDDVQSAGGLGGFNVVLFYDATAEFVS